MKIIQRFIYATICFGILFAMTGCFAEMRTATPATVETETYTQPLYVQTADVTTIVHQTTEIPATVPLLAVVHPSKYSLDIKDAEWLLKAAQEGLSFRVVGIYAIDNRIAFLFGSFASGASVSPQGV